VIELLPALPKAWMDGRVTGLRGRGGFEVDIEWKAGKVTRAAIRSSSGGPCRIKAHGRMLEVTNEAGIESVVMPDGKW
jgi:alpha-L-fucosidase 2